VILITPPDDAAIADTVVAVFRALQESHTVVSTWDRFLQWLMILLRRLFEAIMANSATATATRIGIYAGLIVVVLWIANEFIARSRGQQSARRLSRQRAKDPWLLADQLAAQGDFTGAAHALYAATLLAVAQQRYVTLHESKTIGEYVRELRRTAPDELTRTFTELSLSYETTVYRIGEYDAERYEALRRWAVDVATFPSRRVTRTNTAA
jgi:hypothetical protein